jgi:WhiB family redox-sensing transcriptional regulator
MTDWRDEAACSGDRDPDAWFASPATEPQRVARAMAVCRGCPVQNECAEFALEIDVVDGIWGGLNGADLRDLGAVHRKTDAWAEEGVQSAARCARKSEQDWRVSLGTRGHQRMTG